MDIWHCDSVINVENDSEEADTGAADELGRYNYRVMLQRDKRRWARADIDADGELSKEEFEFFLHPEEIDSMKDIIVDVRFNLFPIFVTYNVQLPFFAYFKFYWCA